MSSLLPEDFRYRISFLWRLPFLLLALFMVGLMAALAGEIIAGMFFGLYALAFVAQTLARVWHWRDPAMRQWPWAIYPVMAVGGAFLALAFVAPFRAALVYLAFRQPGPIEFATGTASSTLLMGFCGVYYGVAGFLREGSWWSRQARQIEDLATAKARSAAMGLTELSGVARLPATAGGPPQDKVILSFDWRLFERGEFFVDQVDLQPFLLRDDKGDILVDPRGAALSVQRPFWSFFSTFIGRREFLAVLTRHVERGWWPSRTYLLKDGDPVYVIGSVEESDEPAAAGLPRRVVRPTREAKTREEPVLRLLFPLSRARRENADVFFLSDVPEPAARRRLTLEFFRRAAWALLWAGLSAGCFLTALRR